MLAGKSLLKVVGSSVSSNTVIQQGPTLLRLKLCRYKDE